MATMREGGEDASVAMLDCAGYVVGEVVDEGGARKEARVLRDRAEMGDKARE